MLYLIQVTVMLWVVSMVNGILIVSYWYLCKINVINLPDIFKKTNPLARYINKP